MVLNALALNLGILFKLESKFVPHLMEETSHPPPMLPDFRESTFGAHLSGGNWGSRDALERVYLNLWFLAFVLDGLPAKTNPSRQRLPSRRIAGGTVAVIQLIPSTRFQSASRLSNHRRIRTATSLHSP